MRPLFTPDRKPSQLAELLAEMALAVYLAALLITPVVLHFHLY